MARRIHLHFQTAINETSRKILTRSAQATIAHFHNAAISKYRHYGDTINDIRDALGEIFSNRIEKYVQNEIEISIIFHEIVSNVPQWIGIEAHRLDCNSDDYNDGGH
jgi:hypothetical protein